jgi:hypothetical protein
VTEPIAAVSSMTRRSRFGARKFTMRVRIESIRDSRLADFNNSARMLRKVRFTVLHHGDMAEKVAPSIVAISASSALRCVSRNPGN